MSSEIIDEGSRKYREAVLPLKCGRLTALQAMGSLMLLLLGAFGCAGANTGGAGGETTVSTPDSSTSPSPKDSSVDASPTSPTPRATTTSNGQLPDLVGKGLQFAQDTAQSAGFYNLVSHDSTGRERNQVLDRNWKVCFQSPAAGKQEMSTEVDFGVVMLEEDCPSSDTKSSDPEASVPDTMPDLVGKSARAAEERLGSNASVLFRDATGQDRAVLVTSNWQVCRQDPSAGKPLAGAPVTLDVVKYGEDC